METVCGERISASQVSAITAQLDATLAAWRQRSLSAKAYRYLIVDAHVERVRREGHVRATAELCAIGVDREGYREHLGLWLGASESGASWRAMFDELIKRGLTGVEDVVSEEHAGLALFPGGRASALSGALPAERSRQGDVTSGAKAGHRWAPRRVGVWHASRFRGAVGPPGP